MGNIRKSALEVDNMLAELSLVVQEKDKAIHKLDFEMRMLERQNKKLIKRNRDLEKVPSRVAEYFVQLTAKGERRNALRDYLLFGANIVVSIVVTIIFKLIEPR